MTDVTDKPGAGLTEADLAALVDEVGAADVVLDPSAMEAYRWDWSRFPGAGMPCAVVRPRDVAQVQAAVRWAARRGIPIVPRGAGTGLAGGSNAVEGGLTISLDRMAGIEIDPATRTAVVEPGALNAAVKGSGLGLAIVRELIGAHGGEITLQTNQPHGLRAVIRLTLRSLT